MRKKVECKILTQLLASNDVEGGIEGMESEIATIESERDAAATQVKTLKYMFTQCEKEYASWKELS
jgi:hypothetical protein